MKILESVEKYLKIIAICVMTFGVAFIAMSLILANLDKVFKD